MKDEPAAYDVEPWRERSRPVGVLRVAVALAALGLMLVLAIAGRMVWADERTRD